MELWPKDDEERRRWCESQGICLEHHCGLDMAFAISRPLLTPHQGPNRRYLQELCLEILQAAGFFN